MVADCDADGNWFEVAVIPHSFSETNLRYLQPGSLVNLEASRYFRQIRSEIPLQRL